MKHPRSTSRRRTSNPLFQRKSEKPRASDFGAPNILLTTDSWNPDREDGDEEPEEQVDENTYRGIAMGFASIDEAKGYLQARSSEFSGTCFHAFEFQIHPKHGPSWKYIGDMRLKCADYEGCYITDRCRDF